MQNILNKYNINEKYTKYKQSKTFTKIHDNIPHNKNLNFMIDLIHMPTTSNDYKYLVVCVDLFTKQFDIEPLKNKESLTVLNAFKKMINRKYIKLPYYSIQSDNGGEFKNEFNDFLTKNNIYHKITMPYRHQQNSMVESLNGQLLRLFNGYMNTKEIELGKPYNNWDDIINNVRIDLNKFREFKPIDNQFTQKFPELAFDNYKIKPKYNIDDIVYYKSEIPLNALGNPQNTKNFRVGDYRYNIKEPRKITNIYYGDKNVPFRYQLENIKNVSYPENEILPAKTEKESKYIVEKIVDKKKVNNNTFYLIKWKNYTKDFNTWEQKSRLIEDGLINLINDYEKSK